MPRSALADPGSRPARAWAQLLMLVAVALAVAAWAPASFAAGGGIHKIKHVVVIMQENRSFDSLFGTYPGADGIPMRNGQPAVCAPDPLRGGCVRPYHDHRDVNFGGPHENAAFQTDLDQGRMDGFVRAHQTCTNPLDPRDCVATIPPDMMGYHDAREIPNYWSYARNYVLQDHMFEPNASWSLPAHLFLTSEWSARCSLFGDPLSCTSNIEIPRCQPISGPRRTTLRTTRGRT
jgi:phospholipase C